MKAPQWCLAILIGLFLLVQIISCTSAPVRQTEPGVTSLASFPAKALGVVINQDGKVLYVEPESAADHAGILPGDVLEYVNDHDVNSEREQIRKIIQDAQQDESVNIKLSRNGEQIRLHAQPSSVVYKSGVSTPTPVPAPNDYL